MARTDLEEKVDLLTLFLDNHYSTVQRDLKWMRWVLTAFGISHLSTLGVVVAIAVSIL